ncbi:MAG: hypothetical protein ACAI37_27530, partial [Chthoniobacter sp.]
RAARRRLSTQFFLVALVKAELLAGAGLLIFAAINRWAFGRLPWDATMAAYAVAGAFALALLVTVALRRSLLETAGILDRLGATRDRFLTALTFADAPEDEPMRALALKECTQFVSGGKFSELIRVRLPREALWLAVPMLSIALLQWETQHTFAAQDADKAAARAAVEDTAKHLEQLARDTARISEQSKTDELQKLAEQLQRSAEQLRANATNPEEAGKSTLRELSALEQMIQEMQKAPSAPTPEEMQALAKALAKNEATKDAASALAAGDQAKAADELEKEMQKLADQKDDATSEEVRKQLEQAIKELSQQKQLSEAMQKLAQQLKESQSQQGGNSSEAAKALAQMLRQMAQGKSGQQSGGKQSAATLEQLLAALQNMKAGEGQSQQGEQPSSGQQQPGGVKMQSFAQNGKDGIPLPGDPSLPSGKAGSEHDTGTTDSPFGKEQNAAGKDGQKQQLAGRMGEGESLQQALESAGDHSKSNRSYKNLYEAMAPAAQDAVLQENIPLGSRFLIKRYFESIRPRE